MADDGQPEPEAAVLAGHRDVGLAEPFEHVREELRIDALAVVTHAQPHG